MVEAKNEKKGRERQGKKEEEGKREKTILSCVYLSESTINYGTIRRKTTQDTQTIDNVGGSSFSSVPTNTATKRNG